MQAPTTSLLLHDIDRVNEIKNFIESNIGSELVISQLAKHFGLSTSTLKRHFHFVHQTSIHRFIFISRMKKAMEMINARIYPISQISEMIGYKDRAGFTRAFTRHYGQPPKFYLPKNLLP